MSSHERIMLADDEHLADGEEDLYKGYNEFHPVLDTRNLQDDEEFRDTVNKSGYGRVSQFSSMVQSQQQQRIRSTAAANSTAGLAFTPGNRSNNGLKSRRTAVSRGTAYDTLRTALGTSVSRPATAVRGAGYTSQSSQNRLFDPLGLASGSVGASSGTKSAFHLQDESTPEWKIKHLEKQIMRLLDESVLVAAQRNDYGQALDLAKDCVNKERSLNRLKEQSGLMETYGPNSDLTFATMFNLAERYSDAQMWSEAANTYQAILKNRSFTNTGRLRMNIGEIYFRQRQYPKAIKFFRMALDQVPNTQNELRLKLMQNIGLAFVRLTQYADAIAAFEFILAERGDWDDSETVFHLIVCYYALGDGDKMKYYFNKLLQVKIEDQFEERYGHHEVLTNGGTIFAGSPADAMILHHQSSLSTVSSTNVRSSSPVLLIRDEQDHYNNLLLEALRNDSLRQFEKEKIRHAEWCVLTAAKLIAPYIKVDHQPPSGMMMMMIPGDSLKVQNGNNENSTEFSTSSISGYDWCLDQIRRMSSITSTANTVTSFGGFNSGLNFIHLADELELYKAVKHLRSREFDQAIQTLKSFERKDKLMSSRTASANSLQRQNSSTNSTMASVSTPIPSTTTTNYRQSSASARVTSTAATNLSFLYLLQRDFEAASKYADEAIAIDRYCLGAILNKGSIYFHQGDFQRAIEHYQEVIANNSTIFEAYFNLALAERKMGHYDRALDALYRLRTIIRVPTNQNQNVLSQKISNTVEVNLMLQIGLIYEAMGNQDQAKDFFQKVLQMVPSDVSLLVKMADMALDENDRKQSLHLLLESYRYLPSHIPTIERLAAYYIEMKMYDQTIKYLEQLAIVQPNQIKWQLMIAASYRRAGNYPQALTTYQSIHQRFPDNVDCLKFLIRLCSEMENEMRTPSSNYHPLNQQNNYSYLVEQYQEILKRLEKTKELREEQKMTSSRSASRASTAAGRNSGASSGGVMVSGKNSGGGSSREGSAATTSSNGSTNSSGYMTSITPAGIKSATPKSSPKLMLDQNNRKASVNSNISAILDQVVEQFDSTAMERPTTSWSNGGGINQRRNLKSSHGRQMMNGGGGDQQDFDEDFLLDANIDEMLPD